MDPLRGAFCVPEQQETCCCTNVVQQHVRVCVRRPAKLQGDRLSGKGVGLLPGQLLHPTIRLSTTCIRLTARSGLLLGE